MSFMLVKNPKISLIAVLVCTLVLREWWRRLIFAYVNGHLPSTDLLGTRNKMAYKTSLSLSPWSLQSSRGDRCTHGQHGAVWHVLPLSPEVRNLRRLAQGERRKSRETFWRRWHLSWVGSKRKILLLRRKEPREETEVKRDQRQTTLEKRMRVCPILLAA